MERHLFYDNSNIISDATVDDTLDATSTASFRHQQRQQHHHREEFMKYVQRGKYCELDSTRLLQELLQLVVQLGENATTTTDSTATKTTTTTTSRTTLTDTDSSVGGTSGSSSISFSSAALLLYRHFFLAESNTLSIPGKRKTTSRYGMKREREREREGAMA